MIGMLGVRSLLLAGLLWVNLALGALSVDELKSLRDDNFIISTTNANYKQLLNGSRKYFLAVLFTTTNPKHGCVMCDKFQSVYELISRSYISSNPTKDSIFFVQADAATTGNLYKELGMNKVPRLWIYPPSEESNFNLTSPHYTYGISDKSIADKLDFAGFVSQVLQESIVVQQDFDSMQFVKYFVGTFIVVLFIKKKVISKIPVFQTLRMLSVMSVLLFTCGYMFTVMRGIPLLSYDGKGEIMYFSGGTHWQFGTEVVIIGMIYFTLAYLLIMLVLKVPTLTNVKLQSLLVILVNFAIFYVFNYLTKIYNQKDGGYPYVLNKSL